MSRLNWFGEFQLIDHINRMKLLAVSTLSDIVCRFDCKSLQNSEFAEFKIKLSEFSYASCADAFWSGRTNPGPGQPLRILLFNGSYVNCSIENLLNGKMDCPSGLRMVRERRQRVLLPGQSRSGRQRRSCQVPNLT